MPVQLQWGLNNEENATLKYKDQVENKENVNKFLVLLHGEYNILV